MRETVLAEVAQRSPTSPETNLESRAMQVRVPWTQAWLCTKDFRRKCTGAGVAAKSRFPAMQPSEALILTLAGGGGRPPKSRRQITVPRSKDRGGNSDFPAGLAGGRLQTARQPSGKEASTMKPARNRAGGVEAVRRVQLHPSRISLSAQ
ncbi:hypothetical protein NDU88_004054 [Pleurodeles waltl]|uniref:Uncharacterized protein n=1 Tax=Pleurodeles waltl TaxID=8319 RepID=A0AAV7MXF4_PLEWA|nr:hypothetical protein NDU88_004054 [Pleurodeles waltl]